MKKYVYLLLCTVFCMSNPGAFAQTDTCVTHLKDASNNYDQGNFDAAIVLLKNTVEHCSLDKADKIQAYKLLIMCYLSVDNLEAADKAAGHIMKINPNYTPDKFKDDPKLIALFKKFRPEPNFAIGISAGINIPFEHTVHAYSVVYPDGQALESYKTKTGFQLGLQMERRAYKDLWVQAGFSFRSSAYQHTLFNVDSSDIHYSEKLTYLDFPLSLKYYFPAHRVMPYLQAGVYFSFLSNALSTTTREDQKDIINRTALRNTSDIGYFGCAGLGYNVKSFMLFFDVRYIVFPDDVNKAGTRYNDQVNLFKYYYLDNDFKLDNMQFNIGASYILSYKNVRVK
jgi:hypothetical protein